MAGRISWPDKYPDEKLTGVANWEHRLTEGVTVTGKDFSVLTGDVTLGTEAIESPSTSVVVEGGSGTDIVEILCEATLSNGDVYHEIAEFRMLEYPA